MSSFGALYAHLASITEKGKLRYRWTTYDHTVIRGATAPHDLFTPYGLSKAEIGRLLPDGRTALDLKVGEDISVEVPGSMPWRSLRFRAPRLHGFQWARLGPRGQSVGSPRTLGELFATLHRMYKDRYPAEFYALPKDSDELSSIIGLYKSRHVALVFDYHRNTNFHAAAIEGNNGLQNLTDTNVYWPGKNQQRWKAVYNLPAPATADGLSNLWVPTRVKRKKRKKGIPRRCSSMTGKDGVVLLEWWAAEVEKTVTAIDAAQKEVLDQMAAHTSLFGVATVAMAAVNLERPSEDETLKADVVAAIKGFVQALDDWRLPHGWDPPGEVIVVLLKRLEDLLLKMCDVADAMAGYLGAQRIITPLAQILLGAAEQGVNTLAWLSHLHDVNLEPHLERAVERGAALRARKRMVPKDYGDSPLMVLVGWAPESLGLVKDDVPNPPSDTPVPVGLKGVLTVLDKISTLAICVGGQVAGKKVVKAARTAQTTTALVANFEVEVMKQQRTVAFMTETESVLHNQAVLDKKVEVFKRLNPELADTFDSVRKARTDVLREVLQQLDPYENLDNYKSLLDEIESVEGAWLALHGVETKLSQASGGSSSTVPTVSFDEERIAGLRALEENSQVKRVVSDAGKARGWIGRVGRWQSSLLLYGGFALSTCVSIHKLATDKKRGTSDWNWTLGWELTKFSADAAVMTSTLARSRLVAWTYKSSARPLMRAAMGAFFMRYVAIVPVILSASEDIHYLVKHDYVSTPVEWRLHAGSLVFNGVYGVGVTLGLIEGLSAIAVASGAAAVAVLIGPGLWHDAQSMSALSEGLTRFVENQSTPVGRFYHRVIRPGAPHVGAKFENMMNWLSRYPKAPNSVENISCLQVAGVPENLWVAILSGVGDVLQVQDGIVPALVDIYEDLMGGPPPDVPELP